MSRWNPFVKTPARVSVVRLAGMIASGGRGGALNEAGTAAMLDRAFERGKPKAVALVVNSPGGSPVQSSLIGTRIRRLADEKGIPVYAFVEDVAASGGYWIASAADEIWVDPASVIGSIGVISASFGLHEFIARYGIERRLHTAGESKSLLDPFQPEKAEDLARLNTILEQLHTVFIDQVTSRRGARLSQTERLFTGDVWIGKRAVDVGLADGVGHLVPKMKDMFGDKVALRHYGPRRGLLQRFGAGAADAALAAVEHRVAMARYGL